MLSKCKQASGIYDRMYFFQLHDKTFKSGEFVSHSYPITKLFSTKLLNLRKITNFYRTYFSTFILFTYIYFTKIKTQIEIKQKTLQKSKDY